MNLSVISDLQKGGPFSPQVDQPCQHPLNWYPSTLTVHRWASMGKKRVQQYMQVIILPFRSGASCQAERI